MRSRHDEKPSDAEPPTPRSAASRSHQRGTVDDSSAAATPSTGFSDRVAEVIRAIPEGQTLSYGAVATFAGRPGGARAVARALHALSNVPWWRVIRADGTVAPQVHVEQARRLRREGVAVRGRRVIDSSS